MNIDVLKKRLADLRNNTKKSGGFWKPQSGSANIRIVPYKFNKEDAFSELYFYYIFDKPMLSLKTFGESDPIIEFAEKLKSTRDKDDYTLAKTFEPKKRIFVPVLVRGEEDKGVRFWQFGVKVYEQLLAITTDDEYGDITDPVSGTDIVVEFRSAKELGKPWPETTIRPRRNRSHLVENKEELVKLFESQSNLFDIYKKPTYEELQAKLTEWLDSGSTVPAKSTEDDDDEVVTQPTKQTKKEDPKKTVSSAEELADEFNDLFANG